MSRYYLNLPVPDPLAVMVAAFEKIWQGGDSRSDPHITIINPREVAERDKERILIDEIRIALDSMAQFPVEVSGVDHFDDHSHVFASVVRSEELVACHYALLPVFESIAESAVDKHPDIKMPHITLASHLSSEKGRAALKEAKLYQWQQSFTCSKLQLMRIEPGDDSWAVASTFYLR